MSTHKRYDIFSYNHDIVMVSGFPPDKGPRVHVAERWDDDGDFTNIGEPSEDRRKAKRAMNRVMKLEQRHRRGM